MNIADLKAELHYARINAQTIGASLSEQRESLNAALVQLTDQFNAEHAELIAVNDAALKTLMDAESALRDALVENYKATGEKTFDKDCGVMVTTKYEYDPAEAVTWAKTNAPVLVVEAVDKKAFEKMPMVSELPFVTTIETPTAKLAKEFTLFAL
jgi:hypothetical protein